MLVDMGEMFADVEPHLTEIGPIWSMFVNFGPGLVDTGPSLVEVW